MHENDNVKQKEKKQKTKSYLKNIVQLSNDSAFEVIPCRKLSATGLGSMPDMTGYTMHNHR